MKRIIFAAVFIATFFVGLSYSQAQKAGSNTIGVVDIESVVKEMPEAATADKMLKDLQKLYNDSLVKMQEVFMKDVEQYTKQKTMMKPEVQQKKEEEFRQQEAFLMRFKEEKFMELNSKRDEYLEPIRTKVKKAIQEVAKEEGMSFAFDKGSSAVLFSEDKFDITFKVIDRIKRGGSK